MKPATIGYGERKEHRCDCGNLLLVMTPKGLEVKCKRCKRIKLIPIP